ncbi:jg8729 [Pararge aegeria aegeria]|uniref:Jg8729 protein n=1 Tax=Pararge aegeria aegeria TaxID=348720 RepID=A0A8S4S603_9NEOP|nr:jg8729 [Pararge aegeria aegeria]
MSESLSSRTKSLTETVDTESTNEPLIADRWTNNITYRQLVMSSCIGIVQLWWHPYVHDIRRHLPFLFLYNVFSVFFVYPTFYLELALGVVTKKGVLNCWDMAPMARGVGLAMIVSCAFLALSLGTVSAWCLSMVVHCFHSFLPWLHCAAAANPPCAARHRPLTNGSETPPQSFFFNFVLNLKRDGLSGGLGNVVPDLTVYYVISWALVYFIACKRIYSYSKLVLFKDVLAFFVLVSSAFGVTRLQGASRIFYECDWSVLFEGIQIWREALEYALIQMAASQGTLIMLGSYCPKQKQVLANTSMFAFAVSKISSTASALILGAAHGALYKDYENSTNIWKGSSSSMVLWADYAARIPGSQVWSALIFFTLFVLSVSSTGGMYILNFLMTWPVSKTRSPIAAAEAIVVTYLYGQTTFCEDVYFAVGEYPCMFLRICWALTPVVLLLTFLSGMASWAQTEDIAGWALVMLVLLPMALFSLLYLIFKFRVRNIVGTEK